MRRHVTVVHDDIYGKQRGKGFLRKHVHLVNEHQPHSDAISQCEDTVNGESKQEEIDKSNEETNEDQGCHKHGGLNEMTKFTEYDYLPPVADNSTNAYYWLSCEMCDFITPQQRDLEVHIEQQHNRNTYKCSYCNCATVTKNYENICAAQFDGKSY